MYLSARGSVPHRDQTGPGLLDRMLLLMLIITYNGNVLPSFSIYDKILHTGCRYLNFILQLGTN